MLLSQIPGLDASTLRALNAAHLQTASHVLSLTPPDLSRLTTLPAPQLTAVLRAIHAATAARGHPATDIPSPRPPVPTGSPALDTALSGGLPARVVTQLAGPPCSGKTQLAASAAASALSRGGAVIWLDTSSTHGVVMRLRHVLSARGLPPSAVQAALARLVVLSTPDVPRTEAALRALRADAVALRAGLPAEGMLADALRGMQMIVFDAVASVLAPVLGLRAEDGWTGHVALNEIAAGLRWFAVREGVVVLVANRVVWAEGGWKPALGNAWAAFVDATVMLERVEAVGGGGEVHRARVLSKRAPGGSCSFCIREEGVVDVEGEGTVRSDVGAGLARPSSVAPVNEVPPVGPARTAEVRRAQSPFS